MRPKLALEINSQEVSFLRKQQKSILDFPGSVSSPLPVFHYNSVDPQPCFFSEFLR